MAEPSKRSRRSQPLALLSAASALVLAVALGAGLAQAKKVDTNPDPGTGTGVVSNSLVAPAPSTVTVVAPVSVSDPPLAVKTKSQQIDGAKGGSFNLGRFTVTVPRGAYYGTGTVTISIPDESKLSCDVSISPATLNGFSVPVVLTMKTSGCDSADPLNAGYWDPAQAKWTHIAGAYQDGSTKDVIAPLYHFSRYGALSTKAGW